MHTDGMQRRAFFAYAVSAFVALLLNTASHAEPAATQPTGESIANAAIAGHQWLLKAKSFYVKLEGGWEKTPAGIARRTAELKKQFPGEAVDEAHFPELRPFSPQTLVIAFDEHRVYRRCLYPGNMDDTRIFDGARGIAHEKYKSGQEHYAISKKVDDFFNGTMTYLSWPRIGTWPLWFDSNNTHGGYMYDSSKRYTLAGRENYRGVDCWVVEKEFGWEKWFIGVDRPLVHGFQIFATPQKFTGDLACKQTVAARHGATTMPSEEAWDEWLATRTAAGDSQAIREEYYRELLKQAHPFIELYAMDWKEIAPGCWFPMTHGSAGVDLDATPPAVTSERVMKVVDIKLNQPLDDAIFQMEFTEGVKVIDRTHDPVLIYKHKKHFSKEEWQAIVDKANEQKKVWDEQKNAQQSIVAKPAPAFDPKSEWINSKPLAWADLKGKVVLVGFFADWCGPCRNDLPTLSGLHKEREKTKITVLAIHPPGSERESIDKVLKEFDLQYPICIDLPPPAGAEFWGKLYAAYRVNAIPHAVVVDADGEVAGQGTLGEMLSLARKLVK